jgi:hypothetical protein
VFAVLTDMTVTGRWYPAQVEEWWTRPPLHGVGSIGRARVTAMERATENDAVVTEYEPPHRAAMKGLSSTAQFAVTLDFVSVAGGTLVVVESTFHFRGWMRLVGPVFVRNYERGWERGLANVKRMIEADEL